MLETILLIPHLGKWLELGEAGKYIQQGKSKRMWSGPQLEELTELWNQQEQRESHQLGKRF